MEEKQCTEQKPKEVEKLSNSLKERLKRCGRYHGGSPKFVPPKKNAKMSSSDEKINSQASPIEYNNQTLPLKRNNDESGKSDQHPAKVALFSTTEKCHVLSEKSSVSLLSDEHKYTDGVKFVSTHISTHTTQNENIPEHKHFSEMAHNTNKCSAFVKESKCPLEGCREDTFTHYQFLNSSLKEKQELLRKLKMVKVYREKNDLVELQKLIHRWRSVSQSALSDLLAKHPEPKPSMGDLLQHLQVDPHLVRYDDEGQEFVE